MQQKIQFIAAVIHEPELLILDEPFSGLDPVNMRLLRDLVIEEAERGATIIFSTHVMAQAEQICDNIVMINNGNKVLDDTLTSIRRQFDPRTINLEALDPDADGSALHELPWVERVTQKGHDFSISLTPDTEPGGAIRDLVSAVPAAKVELRRPTLEDVFVQLVTESGEASAGDLEQLRAGLRANGDAGASS
jgi:ABC-2 type transport system ATP-binding protein